jgi:apolipoprotein N-acyltransferase
MVALIPALWTTRGARPRRGALVGFVFGVLWSGILLWWLTPLTILGWLVLCAGLAGWYALLFAFTAAVWREDAPIRTALAVGAAWAAIEWVRAEWPFGGWGWVTLGSTPHDNPLLLPLASVVGSIGLTFLLATVNALLLAALLRMRGRWGSWARPVGLAAVLLVAPGAVPAPRADGPAVDVAVVQGNVPPELGIRSRLIEDRVVAENHAGLHARLVEDPPDLAIWPENALDRDPTRDPSLAALVEGQVTGVGAPTLVGAITRTDDGRLLNEDLLYDPSGAVIDRYAKRHLLPFGEFVPFRRYLSWIPDIRLVRADLSPGTEVGRFRIPGASFAAVICFENAFPDDVRDTVRPEDGFVVVSTNNSTFGISAAPEQHLVLSELRAVESGRWVVHAALTGISGFISPAGEVTSRTGIFEQALLRGEVRQAEGRTIFSVIGGWLPLVALAGALLGWMGARRPRRRAVPGLPERPWVAVVLPTYNERDNIEEALSRLLEVDLELEVTVMDDSSPDGTATAVETVAAGEPRVDLVIRPAKGGLKSAYLDGFRRAIEAGHDLVVEMDADLSHHPEELPRLVEAARHHHLVIGTRYIPGGNVRNWGLLRRLLSRGGNLYARVLLGFPFRDATSGYRIFRREALEELMADPIRTDGYAFQVELAYRAWRRGMAVGEVPITFTERVAGASKLSRGIVLEAVRHVLWWAIRDRILRRSPDRAESEQVDPSLVRP